MSETERAISKLFRKGVVSSSFVASFGVFFLAICLKSLLGHAPGAAPALEYWSSVLGLWLGMGALFAGVGLFVLTLHDVIGTAKDA